MFDTIVIVDWSGGEDSGPRPRKDAIWAAAVRDGIAEEPVYLRNRDMAEDWLSRLFRAELEAGRRVFAGFDFPFGYPAGFTARVTAHANPLSLWDWFAAELEEGPKGNNRFHLAARLNGLYPGAGPFWFNGLKADLAGLPRKGQERAGHGAKERRLCETFAPGAFTCWQMGGAGAVGGQVMTGMARLSRLRAVFSGQIAVWPFEPLDRPIAFIEVWPSLYTDAVRAEAAPGEIRDRAQVRVVAGIVAAMAAGGALGTVLDAVPEAARAEEGWIFGVPAPPIPADPCRGG